MNGERGVNPKNANRRIYREAYGHKDLYNAEFGSMEILKWYHIKTYGVNGWQMSH